MMFFAHPASAQLFESVGTRAQGMGGAFVAIADDSTATWWNPAGLASGAYLSAAVERSMLSAPYEDTTLGVSVAVPSLGFSYYRTRITSIPPSASTEPATAGRQDGGTAIPSPTFVINQVGVTVGQSLSDHVVLASTLKLARADNTRGDQDIGAMLRWGGLRLAAVVRHLYAPDLTVSGTHVGLDRQARVGLAYVQPLNAPVRVNAAFDADLTTTDTAFGRARHLAGGAELTYAQRLGVRAGVSLNTVDDARPAVSAGASVGVRRGVFVDARVTRGDDKALRGWGFDVRATF